MPRIVTLTAADDDLARDLRGLLVGQAFLIFGVLDLGSGINQNVDTLWRTRLRDERRGANQDHQKHRPARASRQFTILPSIGPQNAFRGLNTI